MGKRVTDVSQLSKQADYRSKQVTWLTTETDLESSTRRHVCATNNRSRAGKLTELNSPKVVRLSRLNSKKN